jgi:hypothetical protein
MKHLALFSLAGTVLLACGSAPEDSNGDSDAHQTRLRGGSSSLSDYANLGGAKSDGVGDLKEVKSDPVSGPVPLPDFVPSTVTWKANEVTFEAATLEVEATTDIFGDPITEHTLSFDVSISGPEVETRFDSYSWDLMLQDGTRVTPRFDFNVWLGPGDVIEEELVYTWDDEVDLTGAHLELNSQERGEWEPEIVPLFAAYETEYPQTLQDLIGLEFEPTIESHHLWHMKILDAQVDRNSPYGSGRRADAGHVFVTLHLWGKVLDAPVNAYLAQRDIEAAVGDTPYIGHNDAGLLEEGEETEFMFAVQVPDDLDEFELLFMVSHDEEQRVSVDLSGR